ncbi:MAG: hypothetical protein Q4P71_02815 [Actinomycetaceae bacterium]|nr:hypothetical protein [Actinomycetaceae bacterium]
MPGSIWIALAAYPVLVGFFIALKRLLSRISNNFDSAVLWGIDIVAGLIVGVFIVCTEDASFLGWNIVRIFCVSICLSAYFNQRVSLYR